MRESKKSNCTLSCDSLLGTLMSLFYYSDINVLPINYAQCELQYIAALRRGQLQEYYNTEVTLEEQHCCSYY